MSAQSASASGITEKELDSNGESADTAAPVDSGAEAAEWLEEAFEALENVLAAIPKDAPNPVLPLYRTLRDKLTEQGAGVEYANTPGDYPPDMFKAEKKKAVANSVGERPGWKPSVISRFKLLRSKMPLEASPDIWAAFEALTKAVSSATPGAREEIE